MIIPDRDPENHKGSREGKKPRKLVREGKGKRVQTLLDQAVSMSTHL